MAGGFWGAPWRKNSNSEMLIFKNQREKGNLQTGHKLKGTAQCQDNPFHEPQWSVPLTMVSDHLMLTLGSRYSR